MDNYFGIDLAREGFEYTSTVALIDNINTILTVPARHPMTNEDAIDCIAKMGRLMDDYNEPEGDRYLVLPPAVLPNRKLKSRRWKKEFKKHAKNYFYAVFRPNKKQWYQNKLTSWGSVKLVESPHCDTNSAYAITK